jgi:putative sugar O-methyltransferase
MLFKKKDMKKIIKKMLSSRCVSILPRRILASLSDNQTYRNVCFQASNDYRYFNNFRRNQIYNEILEHASEQQGEEYLDIIKKDADIFSKMDTFKENDKYGDPRVFYYPSVGKISPTTLRYIKVLADLKALFGTMDNLNICEIGAGYGGQCRIINSYFTPGTYCLIDIKPALMLIQRFLNNYIIHSSLTYKTMNELKKKEYDLLISNYAFTELPRSIQDIYLEKSILCSKMGYITYNEITPPEFKSYKKEELINLIPNSKIMEEIPLTHPNNCIIVWGVNS